MSTWLIDQLADKLGLDLEVSIVASNGKNVPDIHLTRWSSITVHETDNTQAGADARFHNRFIQAGGGTGGVSFTFAVDDKRVVQNLPVDKVNYAQGTHDGNYTSVSVETCVNKGSDWAATRVHLAKLLGILLYVSGLPVSAIVQHNKWYGKDCPRTLRAHPEQWHELLRDAEHYFGVLSA